MMTTYTIMWGHAGRYGHEWTDAMGASRYAADVWGTVEAEDAEAAIKTVYEQLATVGPLPDEWAERFPYDGVIDIVWYTTPAEYPPHRSEC